MITGSIVALVTPMHADGGVDWESLERLLDLHLEAGTAAIGAVGTTGESATLSVPEHAHGARVDAAARVVAQLEPRAAVRECLERALAGDAHREDLEPAALGCREAELLLVLHPEVHRTAALEHEALPGGDATVGPRDLHQGEIRFADPLPSMSIPATDVLRAVSRRSGSMSRNADS